MTTVFGLPLPSSESGLLKFLPRKIEDDESVIGLKEIIKHKLDGWMLADDKGSDFAIHIVRPGYENKSWYTVVGRKREKSKFDVFHYNYILDCYEQMKQLDLNNYRWGPTLFEPYSPNDILMHKKTWKDLKKLEDIKPGNWHPSDEPVQSQVPADSDDMKLFKVGMPEMVIKCEIPEKSVATSATQTKFQNVDVGIQCELMTDRPEMRRPMKKSPGIGYLEQKKSARKTKSRSPSPVIPAEDLVDTGDEAPEKLEKNKTCNRNRTSVSPPQTDLDLEDLDYCQPAEKDTGMQREVSPPEKGGEVSTRGPNKPMKNPKVATGSRSPASPDIRMRAKRKVQEEPDIAEEDERETIYEVSGEEEAVAGPSYAKVKGHFTAKKPVSSPLQRSHARRTLRYPSSSSDDEMLHKKRTKKDCQRKSRNEEERSVTPSISDIESSSDGGGDAASPGHQRDKWPQKRRSLPKIRIRPLKRPTFRLGPYSQREIFAVLEFIDEFKRHNYTGGYEDFKKMAELDYFKPRTYSSLWECCRKHVFPKVRQLTNDKGIIRRFQTATKNNRGRPPPFEKEPPEDWTPTFASMK